MNSTDSWPYLDPHQTRTAPPSPYEVRLARTLEEVFAAGKHDLPDLLEGLNARHVRTPDGQPWTEASFRAEMQRLGA